MLKRISGHLTYANVMSTAAVFIVLGGGAYALTSRDKQQIKVIAKKQASKLDKQIELLPGPKGDQGIQGPKGDKGDSGANGATSVTRRVSSLTTVAADQSAQATVSCQAGERAVGGGGIGWNGVTADFNLTDSVPVIDPDTDFVNEGVPVAWRARYNNLDSNNSNDGDIEFRAYVVCAAP